MDNTLSFDTLPSAVQELNNRLIRIEHILNTKIESPKTEEWFDLEKLIEYLPDHPAKQTVYGMVSRREIPFHKRGKRLIFSKKSIDEFLTQSRRKTITEIRNEI